MVAGVPVFASGRTLGRGSFSLTAPISQLPPLMRSEGEHPLSNAERQARYRQRLEAGQATPRIRYRRPADRTRRSPGPMRGRTACSAG
jgi:hypothetical protein